MKKEELSERLALAERLAREAGALAIDYQQRGFEVELKSDASLVTVADGAVETFLKERLADAFPADRFFGEETGGGVDGPSWIIDPIDGTSNYARRRPFWCVSIGFFVDGAPALGVVYDPLRDEMFHGLASAPPLLNGTVCAPLEPVELGPRASMGFGSMETEPGRPGLRLVGALLDAGVSMRNFGAGALMLAYVASGRFDGYFENGLKLWDAAAALALLKGAGAPYAAPFDLSEPGRGAPVTAAAPQLFEAFVALKRDLAAS